MKEVLDFFETVRLIYQTTRRHISRDLNLNVHRHEVLKSLKFINQKNKLIRICQQFQYQTIDTIAIFRQKVSIFIKQYRSYK
jgi:hypothetical protein